MFPSSFSPFKIRLKEYVIFLFYRNKNILEQNWHYFLFMAYKLNLNKLQNFKKIKMKTLFIIISLYLNKLI